jgi:hypothetical protein
MKHVVFLFTTFNMAMNPVQSHSTVHGPLYPWKKEHAADQSPPPRLMHGIFMVFLILSRKLTSWS